MSKHVPRLSVRRCEPTNGISSACFHEPTLLRAAIESTSRAFIGSTESSKGRADGALSATNLSDDPGFSPGCLLCLVKSVSAGGTLDALVSASETDIATGKKPRPPEVDQIAQAFSVPGENREKVVDEATAILLKRLPLDSDIEEAKAAFDQAQSDKEKFRHDFDGVDFTTR